MKKAVLNIFIAVICVIIAYCSFTYGQNLYQENNPPEVIETQSGTVQNVNAPPVPEETTTENTILVFESYYIMDNYVDIYEEVIPYYLVGYTEAELQAYFSDWLITSFSQDVVVLQKEIYEQYDNQFVLGIDGEYVAIYDNNGNLQHTTNINVSLLSENDALMLEDGVAIENKNVLYEYLEALSS